jgi:hypothetical protein
VGWSGDDIRTPEEVLRVVCIDVCIDGYSGACIDGYIDGCSGARSGRLLLRDGVAQN